MVSGLQIHCAQDIQNMLCFAPFVELHFHVGVSESLLLTLVDLLRGMTGIKKR